MFLDYCGFKDAYVLTGEMIGEYDPGEAYFAGYGAIY